MKVFEINIHAQEKSKIIYITVDLEQHSFELLESTYMWIFFQQMYTFGSSYPGLHILRFNQLLIWRADYIQCPMSFYTKDLSIHRFGYLQKYQNQSPVDTNGQLKFLESQTCICRFLTVHRVSNPNSHAVQSSIVYSSNENLVRNKKELSQALHI